MAASTSCALASPDACLNLPNASSSSSANPINRAYFITRPGDYLPSWGGATGFASRVMSAAKRHGTFAAVIDVGCNTGDWSRAWLGRDGGGGADKTGLLLCVEALPLLATTTRQRLAKAPGGERTRVLNVALSNASGEQPLFGLPANRKSAKTQTGAGLSFSPSEGSHVKLGTVQVNTLDSLLQSWKLLDGGRLFVKVDTEGFDVHVLAGGACALSRGAIDVIQIEWNRRKLRSAAPACVTLRRVSLMLEQFGYEAFLVGRPYLPLNFGHWDDAYEARNLPCPPRCTGDVVGVRRAWVAKEAVVRDLTATPAAVAARPRPRPPQAKRAQWDPSSGRFF